VVDYLQFHRLLARFQLKSKLTLKQRRPIFVRVVRHEDTVLAGETGMIQNRRDIGGRHSWPSGRVEDLHVSAQTDGDILEVFPK
jgi:hypothetical protein